MRTPTNCIELPHYLVVEFSRNEGNPRNIYVRYILFAQEWDDPFDAGCITTTRMVRDIKQFEDLRASVTPRRMKKYLRAFIEDSPGEILSSVLLRGDVSSQRHEYEEPIVEVCNVRLTDHTLAMAEFAIRHMTIAHMNKEPADAE